MIYKWLLVTGIAILMAVFVACGGDDDPDISTVAAAVSEAAPTATVVIPTATVVIPTATVVIPTIARLINTPTPQSAAPTATPKAVVPPAAGPSGHLRVGVALITPANFLPSKIPWPGNLNIAAWGIGEGLVRQDYAPPPLIGSLNGEGIATSWEIASDLSKITFEIRDGVEFHGGWGELTAEDVAFSFNEAMGEGSTWARVEMGDFVDNAVAVNDRTLALNFKKWESRWFQWMYPVTGFTPMVSKKAFDELGFDEAVLTPVFTGPFSVDNWKANDIVELSAVDPHWRVTPKIANVTILEIPEVATRLAAIKTGEIEITSIPNSFLREAIDAINGRIQMVGQPASKHVAFAGNYWIKEDHNTGESIFPRPGLLADKDHPWIGDPDDEESMENARQIRQAMAMAIDRDLINEEVLDGFGAPSHSWYGFTPEMKEFKDEWIIPYDPDQAKSIIAEQGYPDGFDVPFFLPPDVPNVVSMEVGEAIAQMWENIGLDVSIENTAYQARRPTMVARSIDVVWMWQHDGVGKVDTSQSQGVLPSAGWNRGMEIPWVLDIWQKNQVEDDPAKRMAANIEGEDLSRFWMVVAPVVDVSNLWVVRPEVTVWRPYTETAGYAGTFETVELK
jgi:ABC-type transport system substrate-binding protein